AEEAADVDQKVQRLIVESTRKTDDIADLVAVGGVQLAADEVDRLGLAQRDALAGRGRLDGLSARRPARQLVAGTERLFDLHLRLGNFTRTRLRRDLGLHHVSVRTALRCPPVLSFLSRSTPGAAGHEYERNGTVLE